DFDFSGVARPPKSQPAPRPTAGAPILGEDALHGLSGEVVRTLYPFTEAALSALLAHFLVSFGSAVGPGPHMSADAAKHRMNVFAVVVGDTSRARKGTARENVQRLFDIAAPQWSQECVGSGMSSGEGLVAALADDERQAKRLLAIETEFGRVLTV